MVKLHRFLAGVVVGAAFMVFATLPVLAEGEQAAKGHKDEMLMHAEDMVAHGEAGHIDILIKHAKEMVTHAKGTVSELGSDGHGDAAKKHIEMAIEEAEAAIDHGGQGHGDVAMKHANAALEHAKEGASHIME